MEPKRIIDVSRWQGNINWAKVKNSAKVDGVMLRVLGCKNGKPYVDPMFQTNYDACVKHGIPVGAYYFSAATADRNANIELAMFKKQLTGKTFQLPIAVDIEHPWLKGLDQQKLTDLVAYELAMIESWGVYAMLYTYLDFAKRNLFPAGAALKPYDIWLAAYRPTKPSTDFAYGMWQYTSSAKVPGISGDVDMSRAYKDYAAIIKRAGLTQVK